MIAAAGRRIRQALKPVGKWTRRADRAGSRALERAHLPLARGWAWAQPKLAWLKLRAARAWALLERRLLRPGGARLFRLLERGDRLTRRACSGAARAATRASAVITPQRAIAAVILASAACLVASQFIDYRAVQIGQPGYAGLPDAAPAPTVGAETAGAAHSYLLIPLALLAALLGLGAMRAKRRGLGLVVAALGLAALAVILLVDLPSGLDVGPQSVRFSGATAVLYDGFYAELAAAGGLVLGGLLYYARPCRIPINLSGRAASGRRRRPRRRASSRARVARSA